MPDPSRRRGILLVTGAAVAWSTTGLFTHLLTPLDAATMLVWRGLFGALGLTAAIFALEGRKGLAGFLRLGLPGLGYALVSAAAMLCFITALRHTSTAHVAIIYAAAPFLAAGLGWAILAERPGPTALVASAAALAGAILMVGLGADGRPSGDLLALGMTTGMALMMVIARRFPGIPTLPAAALSSLLSATAALPFADLTLPDAPTLGLLAAFGIVNSSLGLCLFLVGSRDLPPVLTALITALDAPLAPLWIWLAFAEVPNTATLAGGAVVLAAVFWHIARDKAPAPA